MFANTTLKHDQTKKLHNHYVMLESLGNRDVTDFDTGYDQFLLICFIVFDGMNFFCITFAC